MKTTPFISLLVICLLVIAPLPAATPGSHLATTAASVSMDTVSGDVPDVVAPLPSPPPPADESIPVAKSGASGSAKEPGMPAHPQLPRSSSTNADRPSVSVSTTGAGPDRPHSNKTKWLIAAAVVAGAGGAMMAMHGKASTPAAATPSLSIGAPSISVGHP